MGFNISSIGTAYLIETIIALYENNWRLLDIEKAYTLVANKYETNTMKIKWNIEKAINSMYKCSNEQMLVEIFPEYDGRKPSTKYAIGLALNELCSLK